MQPHEQNTTGEYSKNVLLRVFCFSRKTAGSYIFKYWAIYN